MESICGECNKPYSKKCELKCHCLIHKKTCFQCIECKPSRVGLFSQQQEFCFVCMDPCKSQEAFYEHQCNIYICKKQLTKCDFSTDQIKLPCGCTELKEHIVAFMSSFCITCLRKHHKPQMNQLRYCALCLNKKEALPPQSISKANADNPIKGKNLIDFLKKICEKQVTGKIRKIPQQSPSLSEPKKQQNQSLIIKMLNQDIKQSQQKLRISQFTRMQLKKSLLNGQRDKECLICNLAYTLANKPMMICMQQHLICDKCFKEQVTLRNCPLCSQEIQKDKVRVSRQRVRTLQMQEIMKQKFDTKYKRFMTLCNNDFQKLRHQFEIKDGQTQTQNQQPVLPVSKNQAGIGTDPVLSLPIKQEPIAKKRGRAPKAQLGTKKQKIQT